MNNKEYLKNYYQLHKEEIKLRSNQYNQEHREEKKEYLKRYRQEHKEEILISAQKYRDEHKEELKIYKILNRKQIRNYEKLRRKTDVNFRLLNCLRSRVYSALKGINKSGHTFELIGCTVQELKNHLEKQFKLGMSWSNYGLNGWEIDHIVPCYDFDLTKPEEQKKCFNYKNLQPLWAHENAIKFISTGKEF